MRFLSYSAAWSGQEIHAVTREETLFQSGVKLSSGQGNRHAALDVEGHHAVEEQVVLPFGNDLGLAVFETKTGSCFQMSADKIPDAVFGSGSKFEAILKAAVGFVGRNN